MFVCMHVCVHVCMYVCVYIYIYIYIYMGFSKIRGTLFWGPYNKDPTI